MGDSDYGEIGVMWGKEGYEMIWVMGGKRVVECN